MLLFQIQNIQLEREMALASNRSLAEQNLDMKPRLESQKELLVERYSQLEAVRETYRQHCSLKGRGRDEHCAHCWLHLTHCVTEWVFITCDDHIKATLIVKKS